MLGYSHALIMKIFFSKVLSPGASLFGAVLEVDGGRSVIQSAFVLELLNGPHRINSVQMLKEDTDCHGRTADSLCIILCAKKGHVMSKMT